MARHPLLWDRFVLWTINMSMTLLPMFTSPGSTKACQSCDKMAQGDTADHDNMKADAMDGWCRAWLQHVKRFQVCGRYGERHGAE